MAEVVAHVGLNVFTNDFSSVAGTPSTSPKPRPFASGFLQQLP
jgi:hypothetical protein